jgi:hypothetical protein
MSDNKMIKISDRQWMEAGIKKGYLTKGPEGIMLRKEALGFLPALGIGAAIPAAWEGGKWLWNKATGNRSLGELFSGYSVDSQKFQQIQKNYKLLMRHLDELSTMSPRVAQAVAAGKTEIAAKMNDMARQIGVAGGSASFGGQQLEDETTEAHKKQLEDIKKKTQMYGALGKGPGGELPKDFNPQAPSKPASGAPLQSATAAAPTPPSTPRA